MYFLCIVIEMEKHNEDNTNNNKKHCLIILFSPSNADLVLAQLILNKILANGNCTELTHPTLYHSSCDCSKFYAP